MSEIKHQIAVYYDEHENRQEIHAEELSDKKVLERAKLQNLLDASEQVSVSPRAPIDKRPHFVATATTRRKVFGSKETDPTHNNRVEQLAKALNNLDTWSLTLRTWQKSQSGESKEEVNNDIIRLPKYTWRAEVTRILSEDILIRHDIFGQSSDLNMSINRPWIAIEVINTHYPEEEAFSAMLEMSKRVPYFVFFDLTEKINSSVRVYPTEKRLKFSPWTYYIKDGALWKGDWKTKIITSAGLEIAIKEQFAKWASKK